MEIFFFPWGVNMVQSLEEFLEIENSLYWKSYQSFFNENNLLLELGSRQLGNFKIVCQVLQTVGQAFSMLLKFSRHVRTFKITHARVHERYTSWTICVYFAVDRIISKWIISDLYLKKRK